MQASLYVGVDIGTSGCRAVAIDDDGRVQGSHAVALAPPERRDGHVQQDPALWWQACRGALHGVLRQVPARAVRALAVDGTSATVLLTDAAGKPLGTGLMYNDACPEQAARVASVAAANSAARGASAALAKLLYLLQHRDAAKARHVLNQADWIAARFSGRFDISDENNALKLGYDPVGRCWPDWIEALGVAPTLLPKALAPGTAIGPMRADVAAAYGLTTDTLVVAGTTDSVAAFIATGAERPGEAVTSLGSTLALKVVSERPIFAPQFGVYSHRLGPLWLAGGASNSGGAVLLQYFSAAELAAMTPRLRPDRPTGLYYYPLPAAGERFPINDPHLPPQLTPRPADDVMFFQGMLEGIARIEKIGYDRLHTLGAPRLTSVRSAGGGANNPAFTDIRRRMLGVPMTMARNQDAAYGAAILAQRGFHGARTD